MQRNLLEGLQPGGAAWHVAIFNQRVAEAQSPAKSAQASPALLSPSSRSETYAPQTNKPKLSASTPGLGMGPQENQAADRRLAMKQPVPRHAPAEHRPATVNPSLQNPRNRWISKQEMSDSDLTESPSHFSMEPIAEPVPPERKKLIISPRRPITSEGKRTRLLSSFWRYTQKTKIEEVMGPTDFKSMSVPTSFDLGADMSLEDLRTFIDSRPTPPQTARSENLFSARRSELQDELKRSRSQGSSSARNPREATPSQFASPGLLVHTSLERLAKLDGPVKSSRPEAKRLAECCHLLECLQVKYFDQEVEKIKEELFNCLFDDYQSLSGNRPRPRGVFLDATPFFMLCEEEQRRNAKLQEEVSALKAKVQDLQFMNKGLKERLKTAAVSREKEASHRRSSISQARRPSTSQISQRPAQVPELKAAGDVRPSTVSSPLRRKSGFATGGSRIAHGIAAVNPTEAEGERSPLQSPVSPRQARTRLSSVTSDTLAMQSGGSRGSAAKSKAAESASSSKTESIKEMNPFFSAAKGRADNMVTKIKDFEDFLGIYRQAGPDEDGGGSAALQTFSVHHKRRKGDNEARWHDFALYLSRHPECCRNSKLSLQGTYMEWREGMGYKAPFSTMLRALIRHNQVVEKGMEDADIEISASIGQDLDPSSEEEEDVEHLVQERDEQILQLRQSLKEATKLQEGLLAQHGRQLEEQSERLELHHEDLMRTMEKNYQKEIDDLEEQAKELQQQRESLRSELDAMMAAGKEAQATAVGRLTTQLEHEQLALKRQTKKTESTAAELTQAQDALRELQVKLDLGAAQREELKKQMNDKQHHLAARMVSECQERHAAQMREAAIAHQQQLEIALEAARGPVKVSERRFQNVMDLFQSLQATVMHCLEEEAELEGSAVHEMARYAFDHAVKQLMESMNVESKYDTDEEEEYRDPAIGDIMSHHTQTNMAPQDLNIEADMDDKKGKGKGKGKGAGAKAQGGKKGKEKKVLPPPISPSDIQALHKTIDAIYKGKLEHGGDLAEQEGIHIGLAWFAWRFWLNKFGSIELAMQEDERVKDLVRRLRGVDDKTSVFGRMMHYLDGPALPPEFGEFFANLKREGYETTLDDLRWTDAVIASLRGLPPGTKGESPEPLDGVIRVEIARRLVKILCFQFELREQPAWSEVEEKLIWDKTREWTVCGVGDVMLAVLKQTDAKLAFLAQECDQHLNAFANRPAAAAAKKEAGGAIKPLTRERDVSVVAPIELTMAECCQLTSQLVGELPSDEQLAVFHFVAEASAGQRPTAQHFAEGVLRFLPNRTVGAKLAGRVQEEKENDSTFITTQTRPISPSTEPAARSAPAESSLRKSPALVMLHGREPVDKKTMLDTIGQPLDPERVQDPLPPEDDD